MEEVLETFELDVKKGILKINGQEKNRVTKFKLSFDGCYRLSVTENFRSNSTEYHVKTGRKIDRPNESGG